MNLKLKENFGDKTIDEQFSEMYEEIEDLYRKNQDLQEIDKEV